MITARSFFKILNVNLMLFEYDGRHHPVWTPELAISATTDSLRPLTFLPIDSRGPNPFAELQGRVGYRDEGM